MPGDAAYAADDLAVVVSESAGFGPGVAVIYDSTPGPTASLVPGYAQKVKLPVNSSSVVAGFSLYQPAKEPSNPNFALYDSLSIRKVGRIWAKVGNTVNAGDDVFAIFADGTIRNDAGSSAAVKVRGAKVIIGGATGSVALIDLNLPLASADASVDAGGDWNVTAVKTSAYNAIIGDLVLVDPTGGAFTVTLPTAVGVVGRSIRIFNNTASTTAVTVATTSSQTINGSSSATMNTAHAGKEFTSDGANWVMVEA